MRLAPQLQDVVWSTPTTCFMRGTIRVRPYLLGLEDMSDATSPRVTSIDSQTYRIYTSPPSGQTLLYYKTSKLSMGRGSLKEAMLRSQPTLPAFDDWQPYGTRYQGYPPFDNQTVGTSQLNKRLKSHRRAILWIISPFSVNSPTRPETLMSTLSLHFCFKATVGSHNWLLSDNDADLDGDSEDETKQQHEANNNILATMDNELTDKVIVAAFDLMAS
ncbi:hypothetical protein HD806DRAFT_523737 [Xylariaceae sp. AK1471]|nr:hypothetical protein HD806DRAFT_523737 [Xylariaceae sp. AK1471]